jgi:lysyl-tRNA synthetase class 2
MNIANTLNNFTENSLTTVKGRVKRIRTLSKKLTFLVVEDIFDSIQIGVRSCDIPKLFDIVECQGVMKLSQTGEKTVWCEKPIVLSENNGDLPNFKGLTDGKLKTEKRFLDILTNPGLKKNLLSRSLIIQKLRQVLWAQNYLEIETPILSNVPSGAAAEPFITRFNALNENFYLRIATEIPLKKAIVAGFEKVFEIGKIFRNEGIDKTHNPEFTSIEMYSSYSDLEEMKDFIICFLGEFGIKDFDYVEYDELISLYGEDFDKKLIKPTFVYGQPIEQTPLCARRPDGKANRFEFFMSGFEVANAYQEITDYQEQSQRFENNLEKDDGLCEALKYGCPKLAGMGIGIDRLIMVLNKIDNIADVIMFPTKRG